MFRTREPQESLWQSEFLITPRKARLMRRSWAQVFRNEAVPLIDEERFAEMYSPDMGRPNRAVQTVLGVLVLKEMFDLTDIEARFRFLWVYRPPNSHRTLKRRTPQANGTPLPSPYRSLTRGGRCRRCLLCLTFHQLLPQ